MSCACFTYTNIIGQSITMNTFRVYHKCTHISHTTVKIVCTNRQRYGETEQLIHCGPSMVDTKSTIKPGLYSVRRSTQIELHKRIYADTRLMAFILLHRSRRVCTQTYAMAVCVPFHGDGFILYVA